MNALRGCLCMLVLLGAAVGGQESHRRPLPEVPPERPPAPQRKVDATQLRREAAQLATLAQSIPADVEQVTQGRLPKDLNGKLNEIQKLAKRLRNEIAGP